MSRWIEQFKAHPFQASWKEVKSNLESAEIDDATVTTSLAELGRLKKVVAYLDGIITGLDPELVPLSTWDSFKSQSDACLQHITNFNKNKNIGHLTNSNSHADNLLTYVRPYMVVEGDIAKSLQGAVKSYSEAVDSYSAKIRGDAAQIVENIAEYKSEARELLASANEDGEKITRLAATLFGDDGVSGVQKEISDLVIDLEAKYEAINGFYNETLVGDENDASTKKEIRDAREAVQIEKKEIESLLTSVKSKIESLDAFHIRMFGVESDENDDEEQETRKRKVRGLAADVDALYAAMKSFEVKQVERYKALNDEIEALLPGANTAGLASAYKTMKESFVAPIRFASGVFYSSIGLLVLVSLVTLFETSPQGGLVLAAVDTWTELLESLAYKLPLYIPISWLAFFASRRRSEAQRLQQEYAHKESLASSYNNFRIQIEALGDSGDSSRVLSEFIEKAIDAITYNASSTLDGRHGDKQPIQQVIERSIEGALKKIPGSRT